MASRFATRAGAVAVGVAVAGLAVAGCTTSGSGRPAATPPPHEATSATAVATSPPCSAVTTGAPVLARVRTTFQPTSGDPFGVAVTPDSRWAFVATSSLRAPRPAATGPAAKGPAAASIEVLRLGAPPAAHLDHTIPVGGRQVAGAAVSRDGKLLLAASGPGAVAIGVPAAERAERRDAAVLGSLRDPAEPEPGAIEVAVSADSQYAFVSEEGADRIAVFRLRQALRRGGGSGSSDGYVGAIPTGIAVVGMAVSPDGDWLYATSEIASGSTTRPAGHGTLSVIDLHRAIVHPATSVMATVPAGCDPVRVVTSADGGQVWVTARESDALLCFDAARLRHDPAHALLAVVRVGAAPVGLALVRGGTLVVVADSDRFSRNGAADLAIVDVRAALAGRPAVLGRVRAGKFPRDMAATPDGSSLLVTNYASRQLETVAVASLP